MSERIMICSICNSEPCVSACLCSGQIKMIGNRCMPLHLDDDSTFHDLVDMDLAYNLQTDSYIFDTYLSETVQIPPALNLLKLQFNKMKMLRKHLEDNKLELYGQIDQLFSDISHKLDESDQEVACKIELLSNYQRNLCEEGRSLMETFRKFGLKGLLSNNVKSLSICIDDIIECVRKHVRIYYYRDQSKELRLEYDDENRAGLDVSYERYHQKELIEKDRKINEANQVIRMLNIELINKSNALKELESKSGNKSMKVDIDTLQMQNTSLQRDLNSALAKISVYEKQSEKLSDLLYPQTQTQREEHFHTFAGKRYIYTTCNETKDLIKYDTRTQKHAIFHLRNLEREFNETRSCELPNGDVFLAGFHEPVSDHVYLFKLSSLECIRLPSLHTPRYFPTLYYYRDYIYLFGGIASNNSYNAERFSLHSNTWEYLPSMKYSGGSIACCGVGNKIYLFCGGENEIEVFDIEQRLFRDFKFDNVEVSKSYGVAYRKDDKVYLVTENITQVYDLYMNKLFHATNTYKHRQFTIGNIVSNSHNIYFYNYWTLMVESIDTSFSNSNLKYHSDSLISRSLNHYLYIARDSTSELLRYDVKNGNLEVIDLTNRLYIHFKSTSLCVLNTGEVLFAGFEEPMSGECYIYNPDSCLLTRLPDLNTSRYYASLVLHKNYVYAFGGCDETGGKTKAAEGLDLERQTLWDKLPDMIYERESVSCVVLEDNIYLIGGGVEYVEVYSIERNSYKLINITLPTQYVISLLDNSVIYVISKDNCIVFSDEFRVIASSQSRWRNDDWTYTLGNVLKYEKKIYYFNRRHDILERIDMESFEREFDIISHKVS
jgi:hypothetical protein